MATWSAEYDPRTAMASSIAIGSSSPVAQLEEQLGATGLVAAVPALAAKMIAPAMGALNRFAKARSPSTPESEEPEGDVHINESGMQNDNRERPWHHCNPRGKGRTISYVGKKCMNTQHSS